MTFELIPATKNQMPVLANLLELYAYDFTEFHDIDLYDHGKFGYKALPLYWTEPGRHPFLVRVGGVLAGFVLVKQVEGPVWDMAEFFVMRKYRRIGIGTNLSHQIWKRFPGQWQVRVMQSNPAAHFWPKAIAKFTGSKAEPIKSLGWYVYSFES